MQPISIRNFSGAAVLAVVCIGAVLGMKAQQRQSATAPRPTGKRFSLNVEHGDFVGISLRADKAKLTDIAAALATRLKLHIVLAASLEKQSITVEFQDLSLEGSMPLLAPHVCVDYEIRARGQRAPIAIYLFGNDDPAPL